MSDLIGAVGRLRPNEVFIFLDACDLRFDDLANPLPEPLPDADVIGTISPSSLFCMLAAGARSAYENVESASGVFTDALLQAIGEVREHSPSCTRLASIVRAKVTGLRLASPEVYQIGDPDAWFLPLPGESDGASASTDQPKDLIIPRSERLASLQDAFVKEPRLPLYVWGESGSGKTTLVNGLFHGKAQAVYWSAAAPGALGHRTTIEDVAAEVVDQLPAAFPGGRAVGVDVVEAFGVAARHSPGLTLVLDHLERINSEHIKPIVDIVSKLPIALVFVTQQPPMGFFGDLKARGGLREWRCRPLDLQEVEEFRRLCGNGTTTSDSSLLALSKGNVRRLRTILAGLDESGGGGIEGDPDLRRAIDAVFVSSGYIHEDTFREAMRVGTEPLRSLIRLGLIRLQDDHYTPHDSLRQFASTSYRDLRPAAAEYWAREVSNTPSHSYACRALLDAVKSSGWRASLDAAMELAVVQAARLRAWQKLEDLGRDLCAGRECSLAALAIAEQLVWAARFELAGQLLSRYITTGEISKERQYRAQATEAERLWWVGEYEACQRLATPLATDSTSSLPRYSARLSLGIAAFFKGEWAEADKWLALVTAENLPAPRVTGWARLVRGTILGLRGLDVVEGRAFLESAIRILESVGDSVGVAGALNNLGEMHWKLGEFEVALVQLSQAATMAEAAGNVTVATEARRNLLHTRLRLNGPFSFELEEALDVFRRGVTQDVGGMEAMQFWDTLATVAAYRSDLRELDRCLGKARALTEGNKEYQIYSLGNQALLLALRGDVESAVHTLRSSVDLARSGQNLLAERQLFDDLKAVSKLSNSRAVGQVLKRMRSEGIFRPDVGDSPPE